QMRFDQAVAGHEENSRLTFPERLAALEMALAGIPRPGIPGSVEVRLPAVVAGDTTVRDVSLSARPSRDGWILDSFAAILPGRTTLEASGKLLTDDELGFQGNVLLA